MVYVLQFVISAVILGAGTYALTQYVKEPEVKDVPHVSATEYRKAA